MNLKEYQKETSRTHMYPAPWGVAKRELLYLAAGLSSEAGEVSDEILKCIRKEMSIPVELIAEEIGDCLWYLSELANQLELDLEVVLDQNTAKLRERYGYLMDRE